MLDVRAHLGLRERVQVKPQPDALGQLHQLGRVQLLVQLGLAGQDDPQHLLLGRLDAGEQADFLEHAHREVLGLIDDQQHLAPGRVLLDQEVVDGGDQLRFLHLEGREAELHQQGLEKIDRRDLSLVDLRHYDVSLYFLQEGLDQGRLARANLACDHHEAVGEPDGRLHVRLGAGVLLGQIQELGIRAQPEGKLLEFERVEIHE